MSTIDCRIFRTIDFKAEKSQYSKAAQSGDIVPNSSKPGWAICNLQVIQ